MNHKIASYREQSTPRGRSAVWFTTIYNEANHMSKFQLYCSCLTCKLHISAQNIQAHFQSKHIPKIFTNHCLHCTELISDNTKFCCRSCAAIYNNARKDYTKFKSGPPKTATKESKALQRKNNIRTYTRRTNGEKIAIAPFTRIKPCIICGKFHSGSRQSCSAECKNKLLSQSIKKAIYKGHDPNKNRGRGKRSWLETSFVEWLDSNQVTNYLTEKPFKRLDMTKTYFADFYFPDKKLIIELDGTQHNKTIVYDQERDSYIKSTYGVSIIRISHKEYQRKSRIDEIKLLLDIKN